MANGVPTEWFDIQVKHGNYLPLEKQSTLSEEQEKMRIQHEQSSHVGNKITQMSSEEIKEAEDDYDMDDEFIRQYMKQRKQQIKSKAQKGIYGKIIQISRIEFVRVVTEANPCSFVLVHLYQPSNQFCSLINQHLPKLASQYAHVKFVIIIANKCIDYFPDQKCPCFIIYKAGKPVANITNIDRYLNRNIQKLQSFINQHGILPL